MLIKFTNKIDQIWGSYEGISGLRPHIMPYNFLNSIAGGLNTAQEDPDEITRISTMQEADIKLSKLGIIGLVLMNNYVASR